MREAHVHLPLLGRALSMVDLGTCTSVEAVLEAIRARGAALDREDPAGERWLLAQGMRVESFRDARWPTRDELDAIAPTRPAFALSFDYHSVVANRAALAAAGIRDGDPDPRADFGVIVRDAAGVPTGLLLEGMCRRIREAVPELSPSERRESIGLALASLERLGFTQVHDMLAPAWLGPLLAEMHDAGELRVRVGLYPLVEIVQEQAIAARSYTRAGWVELLGGKIFVDGTLNARTAWMLEPFADPMPGHPCGTPLMSVGQIGAALRECGACGVGLAAHAIGDGAVRAMLDAVEVVGREGAMGAANRLGANGGSVGPLAAALACARGPLDSGGSHVRVEHCEVIDERDVPRFGALDVIASVQPCHLLYDIEVLRKQLPRRLDRVMPWRNLLDAGLVPGRTLLFGSDVPIVRANPEDSIVAAVERRRTGITPGGPACEPIAPEQALTELQSRACFG
jgi:predicted amidohydrolase YtcJ